MYRHYEGNSGRSRRVSESGKTPGSFQGKRLAPVPESMKQRPLSGKKSPPKLPAGPAPKPREVSPPSPLSGLSGELSKLFGKPGSFSLETEDLLLIAVLYLMYRESGDKELLIMIGALLFL